jgi:hypothetical protein
MARFAIVSSKEMAGPCPNGHQPCWSPRCWVPEAPKQPKRPRRPSHRTALLALVARANAVRCTCGWYRIQGYQCPTEGCPDGT